MGFKVRGAGAVVGVVCARMTRADPLVFTLFLLNERLDDERTLFREMPHVLVMESLAGR